MGSDRYCLRWNNHQNNLLGVFSQLLQEESLVDVTLACSEGHSIRAHKVVLSACSSYFQSLFLDHPNRHPIIILKDVCFAELRTLIEFMYRGEVNLEYCQLPTFLKTAESLQVKGLAEMTHLGSSLSPEREMLPARDGQRPSSQDQLPSSVITTTGTMTAHEPLPLIRRRPGSPIEVEHSAMLNEALTHPSQQFSPTTAPSASPPRPPTASGLDSSHSRSPSSRLPLSVSPYPADTSSPGMCEDRSMSPDPDDDASIQSGPSDMTVNSQMTSPLKNIAGPSNFTPIQNAPLSLKKESNNADWEKNNEERSSSGNNGSDYISKHLHDSALSALGSIYRLPGPHNLFLPSPSPSTGGLSITLTGSPTSPPSLETNSNASSSRSSPFIFSPFHLPVFSPLFPGSGNALEAYARYLSLQDPQSSILGIANSTFTSPSDLSRDLTQNRYFKCAICRAAFPSTWLLEQHTLLQHSGQNLRRSAGNSSDSGNSSSREEKPFQCDQCGQSYRYRSAYIKHREMNHRARLPADKLFTCNICGMQFRYLKSFNKHKSNHTLEILQLNVPGGYRRGDKQSAATQAAKSSGGGGGVGGGVVGGGGAASEVNLRLAGVDSSESQVGQVTSTDEIETQSSTATAAAANKEEAVDSIGLPIGGGTSTALLHLMTRTGYPAERPRERQLFACEYCSKTVRSKENLKLHVRKHTGERPFACLFCGRAFGGKSDLTRHVRIHTGERPYHCEMCGKCFARADYLSKHLTTHLHNSHNSRSAASTE